MTPLLGMIKMETKGVVLEAMSYLRFLECHDVVMLEQAFGKFVAVIFQAIDVCCQDLQFLSVGARE
ncbi:hypothetical protein AeNC1_016513, partial [Aphanomyces euteiches]